MECTASCVCQRCTKFFGLFNYSPRRRKSVAMIEDLKATFDKHEDEYIKFDRVENPACNRPNLCAFLFLDKLFPGSRDMVCSAAHDEIWLDVDVDKFSEVATDNDVLFLTRCGVRFDEENYSFAMFV